jgi:hypothetical protein
MSSSPNTDPLEMLKAMWGTLSTPLPGFVAPTLDADELEKRIKDLKAVEGWLKTNLSMLQMTIQGLEVQRATLAALMAAAEAARHHGTGKEAGDGAENPAAWPWNLMQAATDFAASAGFPPAQNGATDESEKASPKAAAGTRKKSPKR